MTKPMNKIGLALVVVIGLCLGLLWPSTPRALSAHLGQANDVVLQRSSDGHFYADAEVNGTTVHFLVDTGASTVALSKEDAARAGVSFDPRRFELLGSGASGMVRGEATTLRELKLGSISQTHVDAAVVEGSDVSLLGLPFLKKIDEIVIRKDEMTLRMAA